MVAKRLTMADLFCGAGGTSTGASLAAELMGRRLDVVAVNHWDRAVETHAANHPAAAHFCQNLADLDPRKAVPGGKLDLLVASPECTHHSVARGGKPVNDQSRASAWCVLRWATALTVDRILIENVPEFQTWGPIGSNGRPLASKRGETFRAFIDALKSCGYRVEWRVLNAADYGGATTRRRLFVQAARGRRPIRWPAPTHEPDPKPGLFDSLPRWRAAREVIDWTLAGESIFGRKRPLSENTLRRIEAGLIKFGGKAAEPFLVALHHMKQADADGRSCRPTSAPVPTVLAGGTHIGLVEPFLMGMSQTGSNGDRLRGNAPRSVGDPLQTVTAAPAGGCVVQPFIVPTAWGERDGQAPRTHSIDRPVPTVVGGGQTHGVVQPFILPHRQFDGMQTDAVGDPLRTVTATNGACNALVQPFVTPFYANGEADSVADPLRTVTTRDRFGLVQPDGARLDIRFRMLQPHELAAAMGFPAGYRITGNRSEQVRQIGNAVEVNQAKALALAMLETPA